MIYEKFKKDNIEFTYSCILIGLEKYCLEIDDIKMFIDDMLYVKEDVTLELKLLNLIERNSLSDIKNLLLKENLKSTEIDEYKYWYVYLKELENCIDKQNEEWQPFASEYWGFYNIIRALSNDKIIPVINFVVNDDLSMEDLINQFREFLEKIVKK
ncbi:MAG: hypothetical protein FWF46_01850 [Oscillospiraceae bacterium]|nr:hypothetical protein [Oscillospiraceae bacterium]